MASFKPAYIITAKHEGGYANDPRDLGKETYKGISRVTWPLWEGWAIIDKIPASLKKPNAFFVSEALDVLVDRFYLINFWDAYRFNELRSQAVANFIYDFNVNSAKAIREVQKVLQKFDSSIKADNIIGSKTIAAINNIHESILLPALVEARAIYLQGGVLAGWLNADFLDSIIKRSEAFLPSKKFQSA